MKQRLTHFRIAAVFGALLASACGPEAPSTPRAPGFFYTGPGTYDPRIGAARFDTPIVQPLIEEFSRRLLPSPQEREKFCAIDIPAETDPEQRLAFLEELNSRWRRQDGDGLDGRVPGYEIEYSMSKRTLKIGSGFLARAQTIRHRRLCVSRPIESGAYAGFRVLELEEAEPSSATYVFTAKLAQNPLHSYPMLLMTKYAFASRARVDLRLRTLDWVLRSPATNKEEGSEIWVFPHRLDSDKEILP
jgi:hypothetical protein